MKVYTVNVYTEFKQQYNIFFRATETTTTTNTNISTTGPYINNSLDNICIYFFK